jgi:hypothetical protein
MFTETQFLDMFFKLLFRADGSRRSYREIADHAYMVKLCRWSKTSKTHIGSLSRQLQAMNYNEMKIFEECKNRGLIMSTMKFEDFSRNKKLNYSEEDKDTINKPIPQRILMTELAARFGLSPDIFDVSLTKDEVIIEYIKSLGYSQDEIDKELEEIKKIRYKGR